MFEKTSYEISDNVFYGLVAGAVFVGIVGIGYAYLTNNHEHMPENKTVTFTQETLTPPSTNTQPESLERLKKEISTNTEQVLQRENLLKNLRYGAMQDNKNYFEYDSSKKAINKLIELGEKNTQSILTLKIGFPSKLILDRKSKKDFHSWLARLADNIFVLRFLLVEDTTQVVRNKELKRVGPDKITKRGNIIFSEDKDFWWVEIRGLSGFFDELQSVADYVEQAIGAPETMSPCAEFAVQDLATQIKMFLEENTREALKNGVPATIAKFVAFCSENPRGFLPQVDFTTAENITNSQSNILIKETNKFIDDFNKKIIPVMNKPVFEKSDRNENYRVVIGLLKNWIQNTHISEILKQSLFIK